MSTPGYDPGCVRCPRLAEFLADCRAKRPGYFARPVPWFGETQPRLLVVGLAPGLHGANRTGRPFTGDYAGELLYDTLHRAGLSSAARSTAADDGLRLRGTRITNAVKCVPPQNKPTPEEIRNCNAWLKAEFDELRELRVVLALGRIAHEAVLRALALRSAAHRFAHGAEHRLGVRDLVLFDSYHCSRYNTQTRRLTPEMFRAVVERAAARAAGA